MADENSLQKACQLYRLPNNKLSESGWLNRAEIYSLLDLEAQSPKSRCEHGHVLSEGSKEESLLPNF